MRRATKLTGRAKASCGTPILRFVREVLRQRDLLRLAMEFDGPGGVAVMYLSLDECGQRKRLPGEPRCWTTRDRRERDELYLLEEWHNSDMTLQEFAERASGTRLDTSAVIEWVTPWDTSGRPWKDPNCVAWDFNPRTQRLWRRFRRRAGIPSYLPEFQAAMTEAAAGPAFSVVAPALQALASAHDACLRCVGNRVTDNGDDIEEQDPDDRDWREILTAYDAAMRDLLPFLPAGSLEHDGWAHDKNDPVYMAADLVLQPQDAAAGDATAPELQAGPAVEPQDAAGDAGQDGGGQLVTLLQAAALVNRSARTLERWAGKRGFPRPAVLGGGGKPHEYAWSELRPFLEKESGRKLPERLADIRVGSGRADRH